MRWCATAARWQNRVVATRHSSVVDFYDGLAADYHLVYRDRWDEEVELQGRALDASSAMPPRRVDHPRLLVRHRDAGDRAGAPGLPGDGHRHQRALDRASPGGRARTTARYRAITKESLGRAAEATGFEAVTWIPGADAGFHQPVMTARRATVAG